MTQRLSHPSPPTQEPQPTTVAILGLGSRGLSVLERIVTLAKRAGAAAGPVQVELVDPRCDGAGVHTTDQPDYLLLNTTCAQASMFPDAHTVGDDVDQPGPSLYEWATARGLRLAEDGFTLGGAGRPVRTTDFLPRRVLGEYLGWFLETVRRRAPGHVRLRTHRCEAVDLTAGSEGRLRVALSSGEALEVEYAFVTTGYTGNQLAATDHPRLITAPYPLPEQLAEVGPGQRVAIGGFGLSAMDIMSSLTVGRGGRFGYRDDQCYYLPSGREPELLFHSRSGLSCRARPQVMRVDTAYQPRVFTTAAIDALLARHGRLDFDRQVLPLVVDEIRIAYRRGEAGGRGPAAVAALEAELDAAGTAGISPLLDRLDERHGRFDAYAAFEGSAEMLLDDSTSYQKWLAETIKVDLVEGARGFAGSPLKAALDILRALRDTFRYAVDFGALTGESLDAFHRRTVPMLNRAVVGPQYERHCELLALFAAGIARAPFGPAPELRWHERAGHWTVSSTRLATDHSEPVDWVCQANVALPAVAGSASPLIAGLHRAGWVRPHRPGADHLPGIDVDRDQHPIRADGRPERRIWVLGPLCEGATFYNNLVPSPGVFSRPIFDAHRCVAELYRSREVR